ncbi:chemotaxis protein CheW, partial [Acinetobacter baumannii]
MSQSLHLLFSLGEERYAWPTAEVAMVLPLSPCKSLPGAPAWVAGLLPHG